MLVCAGVADFNDLVVRRNPMWHFIVQDVFFVVLGVVAIYGSLWVPANLTNYWLRFVQRINELPQFLLTHPSRSAAHVNGNVAQNYYGRQKKSPLGRSARIAVSNERSRLSF